ncbi:MAG: hypothetical protein K6A97_07340 [Lachnospiraceae bacterium]|nr:hypothetical protein [Lachnospiraceae bacterium]
MSIKKKLLCLLCAVLFSVLGCACTDEIDQVTSHMVDSIASEPIDYSQEPEEDEYSFRSNKLLEDHFYKHGIDMGYETKEEYVSGANKVIGNPDSLHKLEKEDGDDIYYLEETNEFVVVSTDGYIRTYFCPDSGKKYFDKQ